jgi:hypothetical protein
LQLITNSCSLNGLSVFDLVIDDFPEPLMIERSQENFYLKKQLPLRPKIFAEAEYNF